MENENSKFVSHPFDCFLSILNDPRNVDYVTYPLEEVFFLLLTGVLSGCDEITEVAAFGEEKLSWLRKYYNYDSGIPSHDTISRLLKLVNRDSFEELFTKWVIKHFEVEGEDLINIDGKRLRGSADKEDQNKKKNTGAKYVEIVVNVYASGAGLVLAQNNVSDSMDEIIGALKVLDWLDITGCCVSGDANFCRTTVIDKILSKKGDYLLTLKNNWPAMLEKAQEVFEQEDVEKTVYKTEETGHGRKESRIYTSIGKQDLPEEFAQKFDQLAQVIQVKRTRIITRKNQTQQETHYYLTSLNEPIEEVAHKIRRHWLIENQLHYVLDVTFKEDASRTRIDNGAGNQSLIRKVAFNLLKGRNLKGSMKTKRMRCAISDETRENTLNLFAMQ